MIIGIGVDLCSVERIRRSLQRFGDSWIDHIFTMDERRLCVVQADPALLFAQAFCGKEACAKALGTGMTNGVEWRDIEVLGINAAYLRLSGAARERLNEVTPPNCRAELRITCGGDGVFAQAFVIAVSVPL